MAYDFPSSPTIGQIFQGWTWDGEKWLQTLATPNQGGVVGIQVFTSSGTYTPSASMTTCVVEVWGGGGGGGAVAGNASASLVGGGGGGGSYSKSTLTAAQIGASKAIVIGAGGTNPFAAGGAGGATTFGGTLVTANGGAGGTASSPSSGSTPGGAAGTGDLALPGPASSGAFGDTSTAQTITLGAMGASTTVGTGGTGGLANLGGGAGGAAAGYGSGGGGAAVNKSTAGPLGGAGRPGLVIITEYGITTLGSAATTAGAVRFDVAQGLTSNQMAQARANIGIASYTVAALPAGTTGAMVFATNCRMFNGAGVQEGAGAGTGGLVTYNGTAWKIAGTNVTAVA